MRVLFRASEDASRKYWRPAFEEILATERMRDIQLERRIIDRVT